MGLHLTELDEDFNPREAMEIDISDEEVKKLTIGQKIEVVIKGSVGMLQVPPDGSSESNPATLGIRVDSKAVKGKNVRLSPALSVQRSRYVFSKSRFLFS